MDRRTLLNSTLWGLSLRALVSGIPASILLNPRVGRTQADPITDGPGRMLILFASSAGDPINANVPGTYEEGMEDVAHPPSPLMAPTSLTFGTTNRTYTAAKPWAELGQDLLDQTVFFHHATYTPVHQDQPEVMRLMGQTSSDEMLVSAFANALAPSLGTVQNLPISLGANGSELLTAQGRVLANVSPRSIAQALGAPEGAIGDLQSLRDQDIDRIYALYKDHGTRFDHALLDAWTRTRQEARGVSSDLVSRLETIDSDGPDDQVTAAAVLAAMNIAPVLTLRGVFGGDNHTDAELTNEANQTVEGVDRMKRLFTELASLQQASILRHEVVIGTLNVFGRTLAKKGTAGRDHNRNHHVSVLMGPGLRGSVVGGIEPDGRDYRARPIDPTTGLPGDGIPFEDTLASMAWTLGKALQVSDEDLAASLNTGRPVDAALT